jgi:hypothetical protein
MSIVPEDLAPWLMALLALGALMLVFVLGMVWADYRQSKKIIARIRETKRTIKL